MAASVTTERSSHIHLSPSAQERQPERPRCRQRNGTTRGAVPPAVSAGGWRTWRTRRRRGVADARSATPLLSSGRDQAIRTYADAERHQSGREDQFISQSQRRRELVDEDDDAQDHRPPQTGHPEKDHGHHQRRAASKAAEAVARAGDSGAPHQVEGKRPVQRAQLAAAGLARPLDRAEGVDAGQSQRQSDHHGLVGPGHSHGGVDRVAHHAEDASHTPRYVTASTASGDRPSAFAVRPFARTRGPPGSRRAASSPPSSRPRSRRRTRSGRGPCPFRPCRPWSASAGPSPPRPRRRQRGRPMRPPWVWPAPVRRRGPYQHAARRTESARPRLPDQPDRREEPAAVHQS